MARWGRGRRGGGSRWGGESPWRPYVPVARRRELAAREIEELSKKGHAAEPVVIEGRAIARTFWGKAWCENLERYSDFANRLPRGRTYVRNGSVVDLQLATGRVTALVSGSSLYRVEIELHAAEQRLWKELKAACAGQIDSLVELLAGTFSEGVMRRLAARDGGLFPAPGEIRMACSCPDGAGMCKHLAAVLYGVGARLDTRPELLFLLRQVDHRELISEAATSSLGPPGLAAEDGASLEVGEMERLFGIEIEIEKKAGKDEKDEKEGKQEKQEKQEKEKKDNKDDREMPRAARQPDAGREPRPGRPRTGSGRPRKEAARSSPEASGHRHAASKDPSPGAGASRAAPSWEPASKKRSSRATISGESPSGATPSRPRTTSRRQGRRASLLDERRELLEEHFRKAKGLTPAEYRALASVSPIRASAELRRLTDGGLLIQEGKKRGTRYRRGAGLGQAGLRGEAERGGEAGMAGGEARGRREEKARGRPGRRGG